MWFRGTPCVLAGTKVPGTFVGIDFMYEWKGTWIEGDDGGEILGHDIEVRETNNALELVYADHTYTDFDAPITCEAVYRK